GNPDREIFPRTLAFLRTSRGQGMARLLPRALRQRRVPFPGLIAMNKRLIALALIGERAKPGANRWPTRLAPCRLPTDVMTAESVPLLVVPDPGARPEEQHPVWPGLLICVMQPSAFAQAPGARRGPRQGGPPPQGGVAASLIPNQPDPPAGFDVPRAGIG